MATSAALIIVHNVIWSLLMLRITALRRAAAAINV